MRTVRRWCAAAASGVLFFALPAEISAAVPPGLEHPLHVAFDRTVRGDFAMAGNTVTECPPHSVACRRAQNREGEGLNNHFPMRWADVDGDPATFTSSTALLTIPAGASVVHAELNWGGDTGRSRTAPCGRAGRPAGSPREQAVALSVNGTTTRIGPGRFALREDEPARLGPEDGLLYSAHADVTAEFAGLPGGAAAEVGVADVWTPLGRDCVGGWSVVVVWSAADAPSRRVTVHDAHIRTSQRARTVRTPLQVGPAARLGVTAHEGDWALDGDEIWVGGRRLGEPGNALTSSALGAARPAHLNGMSTDVVVWPLPDDGDEDGGDETVLEFRAVPDVYLVQGVVVSWSDPERGGGAGNTVPPAPVGSATPVEPVRNTVPPAPVVPPAPLVPVPVAEPPEPVPSPVPVVEPSEEPVTTAAPVPPPSSAAPPASSAPLAGDEPEDSVPPEEDSLVAVAVFIASLAAFVMLVSMGSVAAAVRPKS
ncbi:hypothetical protein [Umezawaea beigongshangensis]|uniref:hypothetical protein n=1 Tax=Umezawaea beigongshangensis TaxID=2780383 RepID=UPI0018F1C8FF|nr:hypothetical protein [Umezawaea beigongshangensis]